MAQGSTQRLTREAACEALGVSAETLAQIERAGGLARSEAAERKIASVAAALSEVRPALERLADLPGRAGLEGEGHDKAMIEVAAFFTAFAEAMNKATAILTEDDGAGPEPA